MLKIKTGTSTNSQASMAGKEAAAQVKENLQDMKMAFVYSGVQYDQKELLDAVSEELPGVPLIGNTSFTGVITQEGFVSSSDGFVGVMALSDPELKVSVAGMPKEGTARETGHKVAAEALRRSGKDKAPDFFYMSAPSGEEEYYLKGITEVIGRVPFFGGSAADNAIAGEWLLYTDEMVTADGVSVAFFYTDKPFANKFTGAYHETKNAGIITKVTGDRTLAEINGDLTAIRHPMNGNDDGTMNIGNNLAVGTAVIQMEATVDELIEAVGTTLKDLKDKIGGPIAGLHLVHCGGRRAGIDSRIDEVTAQVKKAVGDIPFIMEFTFGEYGYEDDGNNTCGGLMLSFTAFGK